MIKEIWKPVMNYEGFYEVSNLGNIRSIDRFINKKFFKGVPIKLNKFNKKNTKRVDYRVFLSKNNKQKTHFVSRLVASSFLGNKANLQVNHIDGNPLNNFVDNLEWVTQEENIKHAFRNGLIKNIEIIATKNCENFEFKSLSEASKKLSIDIASISMVLRGYRNRKKAKGFILKYKQKNRRSG